MYMIHAEKVVSTGNIDLVNDWGKAEVFYEVYISPND